MDFQKKKILQQPWPAPDSIAMAPREFPLAKLKWQRDNSSVWLSAHWAGQPCTCTLTWCIIQGKREVNLSQQERKGVDPQGNALHNRKKKIKGKNFLLSRFLECGFYFFFSSSVKGYLSLYRQFLKQWSADTVPNPLLMCTVLFCWHCWQNPSGAINQPMSPQQKHGNLHQWKLCSNDPTAIYTSQMSEDTVGNEDEQSWKDSIKKNLDFFFLLWAQ